MRPLAACVLVGSLVLACGSRADLLGAPAGTFDAGLSSGGAADAGVEYRRDGAPGGASATVHTDAMVDAGEPSTASAPRSPEYDGGPFQITCVSVDLQAFDSSCNADSDCMAISAGTICPSQCIDVCPNTAINVDGKTRYDQILAQLPSWPSCECGFIAAPDAFCVQGVCTFRR
jgi:hypothetical protein